MLQDLLVNAFFLFLLCCFVPLLLTFKNVTARKTKLFLIISCSLAIIACISFPIRIDGVIIDLRLVAQIYGSLYGGPVVAVILALVNISYRSLFGGIGVITTLIIAPLHLIILLYIRNWFMQLTSQKKSIAIAIIGLFSTISTVVIVSIVRGKMLPLDLIIYFSLLQIFALVLVIYIVEVIRTQWLLQTKLYQSEKMETVSHLAASISHEVRNPLTSARGFMQLLHQSEVPRRKQKEFLELSISELDRAEAVIQDYLAFAKPTAKGSEVILEVKEEVERTVSILQPFANMHSIHILNELTPFNFRGNQQYFKQCLVNICKNAIEAMEPHSKGNLTLKTYINKNYGCISIKDTGVGMTQQQIARLGEPYYSTKGSNGTGLGTMFVFRTIEEMGGKIKVLSEKGSGTEFIIYLPLVETE